MQLASRFDNVTRLVLRITACVLRLFAARLVTADSDAKALTLIANVPVFDGVNEDRTENAGVLIEGNLIKQVSRESLSVPDATIIDGGGRTLIPGLIDGHNHIMSPASALSLPTTTTGSTRVRWSCARQNGR